MEKLVKFLGFISLMLTSFFFTYFAIAQTVDEFVVERVVDFASIQAETDIKLDESFTTTLLVDEKRLYDPYWITAELYPLKVSGASDVQGYVDVNFKNVCYIYQSSISCVKL